MRLLRKWTSHFSRGILISLSTYLAYLATVVSKHSKWAKIKRKKGVADVKKGAAFTKLVNAVAVAARDGSGADPASNFKLRLAIDAARAQNVPKENIERAILRGTGKGEGTQLETLLYEGFGPGGVAVLVDALTDNRNRTVNELKHIFSEHGGTLGASGSVSWGFEKKGIIRLENAPSAEQELALIDVGAEDIRQEDDVTVVTTAPDRLEHAKTAGEKQGVKILEAELAWIATTPGPALSEQQQERLVELLSELEERDDVTGVATNAAFESN